MEYAGGIPESELPILTEENIIVCVKDYINVQFSISELRQPTPEKLQTIFGAFVCKMLQVSNEQMTQIPLHVLETMAHRDLHVEEGAGVLLFTKALAFFMERCGIRDFALTDIFHPTKKRTRKLLSAVVNFVQFTGAYCDPTTSDILSKIEIKNSKDEQYTKRREELRSRIAELKSQRLEKQRAVQDLKIHAIKAYSEELEAVKKEKLESTTRVEAEVEELRNLLTIARAKRLTNEAQETVDNFKERTNAMIVKEGLVVTQIEEVTPPALKLIHAIEEEAGKVQVLSNDLEKLKDNAVEITKDLKDLVAEMQNIESLINGELDKKARFVARCNKWDTVVQDTELKLSNKRFQYQEELKIHLEHSSKIKEELNQIDQLIKLQGEEHDVTMSKLSEQFDSLQSKLLEYNNKIIKAYQ